MTENTFPLHSVDKIVAFYRNAVLTASEAKHFTKSDLTPTPKAETVQTLYMRVLHLLFRFKPECHSMVSTAPYSLVQSSFTLFTFSLWWLWQQFLPVCMVYDFSLSDLLNPKKQRTLTILSAIMNFLHFRNQRMEMIQEKQGKFRADVDRLQAYTRSIRDAERKIEMLTTIPPEQQAEANELAAALAELNTTTAHEYQEVNTKTERIAELKSEVAEKTQKLAQMKVDVSSLKEDISKLKSQIVESPEELKSQMEKMRDTVKNIKNSIEEADERVVELQSMVQGVSHTEAEIQHVLGLLQDLEASMSNCKQQQDEHQELIAQYEKLQKELKNLCVEEGQLKRALDMKRDKECKLNIRRQKKKEMKEQHVKEVLGYGPIHQKREEMADKIQKISGETQQLRAKIKSLRDICGEETEKAQAIYNTLSAAMGELHQRIEAHSRDLKLAAAKMSANI
uniref:Kinetochore protein Nuf2-like n=1 Tax=Salarias fasciatus TaxID=181472 RepID=A0A672GSB7_SALFA